MNSTLEEMDGTYRQEGDYMLPNVETPESPAIGIWGQRRRKYLQENQKPLYTAMLLNGTLNAHLEEVDRSATEMFDRIVEQLKRRDNVTEELKATDPLEWMQCTKIIHHEAAIIVTRELIYV